MNIRSRSVADVAVVDDQQAPQVPLPSSRPSVLGIVTLVGLVVLGLMAFFYAPEDLMQGPMQRIFYIHVPSAWVGFVAFFVVFVSSISYLSTRKEKWDTLAAASAEVGFLFTTVVLLTGMMWGRVIWGVFWTWEPRLTSFLVLWLLYLAYLALRTYVPDPARRARFSAVVGIIAFLDVPIVYLSVRWWRTLHPEQVIIVEGGPRMPGAMVITLMVGLTAITLLYAYLVRLRLQVRALEAAVEEDES
jgi:heme exporter protein C